MGFRVATSLLAWSIAVAAQAEPERTPSPLRAVHSAAIAAPCREGLSVEVVSEMGRPVAHAIVGVLPAAWTTEQAAVVTRLATQFADEPNEWLAAVLLQFGERHRCDDQGRVIVPATATHLAACDGVLAGELQLAAPAKDARVTLLGPLAMLVRVVGPDGRPVVDQRVAIVEGRFPRSAVVRTDGRGEGTVSLSPGGDRRETSIVALVAGAAVRVPLPAQPLPRAPVRLQLPPTGLMRVIAYDDREQPRTDIASVQVRWQHESWPLVVEPDAKGDVLVRCVLGERFEVDATLRGTTGPLHASCAGPSRAGELVVCDVRATQGPPVLVFRVSGIDGGVVGEGELRGHLVGERGSHGFNLGIGTDGRVRLAVDKALRPDRLIVQRRAAVSFGQSMRYLGAAIVPLPAQLGAGDNVLPDVRLVEEPVVAAGSVVDDQGKPVANVGVGALPGWMQDNRNYSGAHDALFTDVDGRFEVRDISEPGVVKLSTVFTPAGYEPTTLTVARGNRDVRFVVARQGRVRLRFDGVPDTAHDLLYASLVPAGGEPNGLGLSFKDGDAWLRKPAGRYDLVLSLRRNEMEVVRIPDVVVQSAVDTEDPRLVPFAWRDHLLPLTITAVDEAGKPVEGCMVWCLFAKANGGEAGGGGEIDAKGQFFTLVPKRGARFQLIPSVRSGGPVYRAVELPNVTTDQRVVLRAPLRVCVRLQGDRLVPGATHLKWQLRERAAPLLGLSMRLGSANEQPAADGTWNVTSDAPGDFDVVMSVGVPEGEGRVRLASVTWGTIAIRETGEVQTFTLAPDDEAKAKLAELRERLAK